MLDTEWWEEDYHTQVHFFNEAEDQLNEYFHQFNSRSQMLMEWVQDSYKGVEDASADSYLNQMEEIISTYTRSYHQKNELLEEVRYQVKKEFNNW